MDSQEFKPGDKVKFRMGNNSIYGSPNYPVIPMTVEKVLQQSDGSLKIQYTQQWYYNGFGGTVDSKWLAVVSATE